MFENKTLIILGAGASVPYGYPTGAGLIDLIKQQIETDTVWIPFFNYINPLLDMKQEIISCFNSDPRRKVNDEGKKKINEIPEIRDFYADLIIHRPTSIDSFVFSHPKHEVAAKVMIAYVLLSCEKQSFKEIKVKGKHPNREGEGLVDSTDDWYSYIITDLLEGCENMDEFLEKNKNLTIATFNYDESLEYFILKRILLPNSKFFKSNECKEKLLKFLKTNIIHIHGRIHGIEKISSKYGEYNPTQVRSQINEIFYYSLYTSDNIKLLHDKKENNLNPKISDYKDINIIGFSFDRDNLNQLGFPSSKNGYKNLKKIKSIKWMDYGGKMNSLNNQFLEITEHVKTKNNSLIITRSTATSITDAYQNDFKVRLF